MRFSWLLILAGAALLAALVAGGAGCGEDGESADSGGLSPAARVYALMLQMDTAWQPLLVAQKADDFAAVRKHAKTLARQARDADLVNGREGEVWQRYALMMQEGADALAGAEDATAVKTGLETLERSCNECHRRFQ